MGRVRYSLAEAEAEATRRAATFVAKLSDRAEWRYFCTNPDYFEPPRSCSKHPVVWCVTYAPIPEEDSVIDGGELFILVDLELNTVSELDYWNRKLTDPIS